MGNFVVNAKISYTNIEQSEEGQELLLKIYTFRFAPASDPTLNGQDLDLSNWFSFVITSRGEILRVYHPDHENGEVLAIKKGFAALLAAKLHNEGEVGGKHGPDGWTYHVQEMGHEGLHNATYTIQKTNEGLKFVKVRHGHPVKYAQSQYKKTIHYHDYLGTIHKVLIEEDFTSPNGQPGFDPHHGMRKVKAVNNFTTLDYPEMKAISNGELHFLTRNAAQKLRDFKPKTRIQTGSINIGNVKRNKPSNVNITQARIDIHTNLTCMQNQPEKGSPVLNACFNNIIDILHKIPDSEINKIAQYYLQFLKPSTWQNRFNTESMLDALGVINTDQAQQLLNQYVLRNPKPNHELIQRVLIQIVSMDVPPHQCIMETIKEMTFEPYRFPKEAFRNDTHHRFILALGSVAHKLEKNGRSKEAHDITHRIHDMLGMHDPWLFRQKRATMDEAAQIAYDLNKVVLLESLGNAGLEMSFPYIVSHINDTNAQWIKRAGCHALRKYNHQMAANALLKTALFDEDQNVRYEALLLYQAHPKSRVITPLNNMRSTENQTLYIDDPYDSGITDLVPKHRSKRGIWDGIEFRLEAPSVDWRKMLGSEKVGASFGVIMINVLDLKIAPLSGYLKLNIHDEAYARVHLGIINLNLDFFVARVCFKGGAEYNFNILQGNEMKKIIALASQFDKKIKEIVDGITTGVEFFKDLISGRISIKDIVVAFVNALKELPGKVINMREKAGKIMVMIGQLDDADLPAFLRPTKKLVTKVSTLFNDIKSDVMNFYNTLVETVTVVVPHNAKVIYEAILDIVEGFKSVLRDPKTAIKAIGRGAIKIFTAIKALLQAKNKTQEACFFLKEKKPYWWDIETEFTVVSGLVKNAATALANGGPTWIAQQITPGTDPVEKLSKGKIKTSKLKKEVISNITSLMDEVLEPFDEVRGIADKFIKEYSAMFNLVKAVKDAYTILKEGYDNARAIIDGIFGPKAHKDFPRSTRIRGGGCSGTGFYPGSLKHSSVKEYGDTGIDIQIESGQKVVSPFAGTIELTNVTNQVLIKTSGGSLRDMQIRITNVKPNATILKTTDPNYIKKQVQSGQIIGTATKSACTAFNHIHFSIYKTKGTTKGWVDPSRFLTPRFPLLPVFSTICDDYKLVFKFETIAAGTIVGLGGKKKNDTSPSLKNKNAYKALTAPPSSAAPAQELGTIKSPFRTLIQKADSFLQKFSLRRLKMGTIIEFLDILGLTDSKQKMADVIKTIKRIIDNKPCFNPNEMTEEQLKTELTERGANSSGTREEMIARITKQDNKCPLLQFNMPKKVYCTFDSLCLGMECCMNVKLSLFLKVFRAYVRYDPCDYNISMGIDTFKFQYQFQDPTEGIMYMIRKTTKGITVTFGAGFCNQDDYDSCIIFVNLLENALLPIPTCSSDGTVVLPKVNFKDYFTQNAIYKNLKKAAKTVSSLKRTTGAQNALAALDLPDDVIDHSGPCPRPEIQTLNQVKKMLRDKGLTETGTRAELNDRIRSYDTKCTDWSVDYRKWLPINAKQMATCALPSTCYGLQCCLDLSFQVPLGRETVTYNVPFHFKLDTCDFSIDVGFNTYRHYEKLLTYDWGRETTLGLGDSNPKPVQIEYNIARLSGDLGFRVSLRVVICFPLDAEEYCVPSKDGLELLRNEIIPTCDSRNVSNYQNFSLTNWVSEKNLTTYPVLNNGAVDLLLEELNLTNFFGPKCDRTRGLFSPSVKGFRNQCPFNIFQLPSIDKPVTCSIPSYCTGVECCAEISYLRLGLRTWLYLLTMKIVACFEENGICNSDDLGSLNVEIMKGTEIPMVECTGLSISSIAEDFSLINWKSGKRIEADAVLNPGQVDLLQQQLGMDTYIMDPKCNRDGSTYTPQVDGWKNECSSGFTVLAPVNDSFVSCALSSDCSSVDCCVYSKTLSLNFNFKLQIDACNYEIKTSIEKYTQTYNILNFPFASTVEFSLSNVMKMRYKIERLLDARKFIVDLDVLMCFEQDSCVAESTILSQVVLPEEVCNLNMPFLNSTFSLDAWMNDRGLPISDALPSSLATQLFKELGIDYFLHDSACYRRGDQWAYPDQGWTSACPASVSLSKIRGPATCHLIDSCTGVDCCLDISKMGTSFRAYMIFDACNYRLHTGIDRLSQNISLFDFRWGIYNVYDLYSEGAFLVNMNLSVCLEAQGNCLIVLPVFENVKLPKQPCTSSQKFIDPAFSLATWQSDNNVPSPVRGLNLDKLLNKLGMSSYLMDSPCSKTDPQFVNATSGWDDACPNGVTKPSLGDPFTCHLMSTCTGVECCINVDTLDRTIHTYVIIDSCNFILRIGIEKLKFDITFRDHDFGTQKSFRLANVIRVDYQIYDLSVEKQYLFSMKISVCFEQNDNCQHTATIFDGVRLPKTTCDWTTYEAVPDFSLSRWIADNNASDPVTWHESDRVLNYVDVARYIMEPQCNRSSDKYTPSVFGWSQDCPEVFTTLPLQSGSVLCYITSSCTQIECCVDVQPLGKSFTFTVNADYCNREMTVGIDQYKTKIPYMTSFGILKTNTNVQKVLISYSYKVENLRAEKKYVVDMRIKVCLEAGQACLIDEEIARLTHLPKQQCPFNTDYSNFSLTAWQAKESVIPGQTLTADYLSILNEELGITGYLQTTVNRCDRNAALYQPPSINGWKIDCASVNQSYLNSLSEPISCVLPSACTGFQCCMDLTDTIQQNLHFFLELDECLQRFRIGVEALKFKESIFDFQWDTLHHFRLRDMLQLSYIAERVTAPVEGVYLSANVSVCYEPDTVNCQYAFSLMDNVFIPKRVCDYNLDYVEPGFSLEAWYTEKGLTPGDQLSPLMTSMLLDDLEIAEFLETDMCQRSGSKYSPAVNGWKSDCPLDVSTTDITGDGTCLIPSTCTAVDCCVDVGFMSRSFRAHMELDPCGEMIRVGVERLAFNLTLAEHGFGMIFLYYKVEDLPVERQYKVNMKLQVCFESSNDTLCIYNKDIFVDTLLPKLICDWTADYSEPGFSLVHWYRNNSITENSTLSTSEADMLLSNLGIKSYMLGTQCDFTSMVYSPADTNGWRKDCDDDITGLPTLPSEARCNLPEGCSGAVCCLDVDFLQRNIQANVTMDTCNQMVVVTIERLVLDINLYGYQFGTMDRRYVMNVIRLEYTIHDDAVARQYRMTLDMKVCFETNGNCHLSVNIFNNVVLPKQFCHWGTDYLIPDFSLTTWAKRNDIMLPSPLNSTMSAILSDLLGITTYLKDPHCNQGAAKYTPNTNGWKKDCAAAMVFDNLDSKVVCNIESSCTSIDCCVDDEFLGHTLNTYVRLDPCTKIMSVGIEGMQFNTSLAGYRFGTDQTFTLQGAIQLSFNIRNLPGEAQYQMSMSLSTCYEALDQSNCVSEMVLFSNAQLPKTACNWNIDYKDPAFHLHTWLTAEGYTTPLNVIQAEELLLTLGIKDLMENTCDRNVSPYSPNSNGWNIASGKHIESLYCCLGNTSPDSNGWNIASGCTSPPLPADLGVINAGATCHLRDSCIAVDCCMDSSIINQPIRASLVLDACNNTLKVSIEKLNFEISLFDYVMGSTQTFALYGVVSVEYSIYDLTVEGAFVVTMKLKVCYDKFAACEFDMNVFTDTLLHKPQCDYGGVYPIPNFSLVQWMSDYSVKSSTPLEQWAVDLLMEELHMSRYLEDPGCSMGTYFTDANKWDKGSCGSRLSLQTLPSYAACRLPSYCTGAQCCVDVGLLGRTLDTHVFLDACNHRLSVGLEKLDINITLFDYVFDQWKQYSLSNVLRVDFKITDLRAEKIYVFNMNISVCFESSGDCRINFPVFSDTRIPMTTCDFAGGYAVPGFVLADWLTSRGVDPAIRPLPDVINKQLVELLGVAEFMEQQSCDNSSAFYTPRDPKGFKIESRCAEPLNLPTLPQNSVCHIHDTCTGVTCCHDVTLLGRPVSASLKLDACEQQLLLSFERFQFNISLFDFEFGEDKTFHLDQVFKIDYNILDLTGERAYLVSMTISACFNDPSPCDFTTVILDRAVLPKPPCAWYTGFKKPAFSLAGWKSDNSYPANQVLPAAAISNLMDDMGILDFLENPACNRQTDENIYANAFEGWVSEVNELQRTMRTFVDVDLCNYQLRVGIDRLQFNRTLKGFNWGELDKFDLYGVFVVEYMMTDLHADSELLLNMNISVCYESSAPCDKVFQVFKNTKVPKTTCDWKIDFIQSDFSLTTWMTGKGLNPSDPLQPSYVSELFHDMGVADLISDNSCERNGARFTGIDANNWRDECNQTTQDLNSLGATTSCRITSECTEVECCMDVNKVGRSFNMYVYADVCNYKLTVGIEKLQLNYSLVDYNYGQSKHVSLYGMINLDFMLNDLSAENLLVFDMNMSVCFEAQGSCEVFTGIFSQAKLNKPTCNWNTDFAISDFSLKNWLSDKELTENETLSTHTLQELLHDLDLAYFMKDSSCQRQGVPFAPAVNGWNNGCPQSVSLPTIPGNDTCHLYDYCTGVRCCVEVETLQRTIDFTLSLDPCNYRLTINIEKFSVEESLFTYTYGQTAYVNLQGVIRLEYMITDLVNERLYQVDLSLKVCFESSGPCILTLPILVNTALPKQACRWDSDFVDTSFSIVTWRQQENIDSDAVLTPVQLSKLMADLGIKDFMEEPKCNASSSKYTPSVNGWKDDCNQSLDSPLPMVPDNATSCVYDSTCTTTECCVGVSSIGTVFSTYVRVDPCTFTMQVGSENLKFSKDIFDYDYGIEEQFWLFGVSRIKFSILDLTTQGYYLTNMELKVCLAADTENIPCDVIIPLLTNYKLPKRSCDWNTQIMDGSTFNLTSWLISESLPDTYPLQDFVVSRLISQLGLTKYLSDSQCDPASATYTPSVNGWNNECYIPSMLPTIIGNSACQVTSECTKINCCLDVPLLNRTFSFYLHIDACYKTLSVGIEKQVRKHSLIGYSFGTVERFNLRGAVRVE
ncbi:hypothetical protein FSP39_009587 [Pinctada imbricata]|uniref:SAP domain-containing protein n=1 Tax=Pinctada imbricata TaxID=66713 RepID=A0AA88YC93_PINIB|nr:hypothetical protein FSP39_009587 [Pinctada imbricata]